MSAVESDKACHVPISFWPWPSIASRVSRSSSVSAGASLIGTSTAMLLPAVFIMKYQSHLMS
ncbi:MAG TPA: hypothetical protein DDZ51_07540 [Planctomycetaceae bacterium]|nr:hypothetical protein [Planctomycetaceae bacterium]